MILPGENVTRDRAIFDVTFTYRAQQPRPTDRAGETDTTQPITYESGITTRTLHILAPSAELAKAYVDIDRGANVKDYVFVGVEVCPVQLDTAIPLPIWGGRA